MLHVSQLLTMAMLPLWLTGCGADDTAISVDTVQSLNVIVLPWSISISKDGSGTIVYGSDGAIRLPAGTVDFVDWGQKLLNAERAPNADGAHKVTLSVTLLSRKRSTVYISDVELAKSLIQRAIHSTNDPRIHELWKQHPIE